MARDVSDDLWAMEIVYIGIWMNRWKYSVNGGRIARARHCDGATITSDMRSEPRRGWVRPSRTMSSTSRAPSSATRPGSGAGLRRPVPGLQDDSGVEDAARIQRILDPCGHRHHVSTDLIGQPRCLETTDAVLTGDRSAELDRSAHDVAEGTTRASFCVAVAGRGDDH